MGSSRRWSGSRAAAVCDVSWWGCRPVVVNGVIKVVALLSMRCVSPADELLLPLLLLVLRGGECSCCCHVISAAQVIRELFWRCAKGLVRTVAAEPRDGHPTQRDLRL